MSEPFEADSQWGRRIERALFDEDGQSRIKHVEVQLDTLLNAYNKARFVGWILAALVAVATPLIALLTYFRK